MDTGLRSMMPKGFDLMEIVPFDHSNIDQLTKMIVELWPECKLDQEYANCVKAMESERECYFLARAHGQYIAFIYLNLRFDYVEGASSSPVGYIEGIYVKPAFRKQGVAKMLIERAEKWCRERGTSFLGSDTETDNLDSVAFHLQVGFKVTNRLVTFIKKLT